MWGNDQQTGIGCAGEIRINENEDYEKWAIDILIKFRSSEKLQLLTAHRQSGGVRHLSILKNLCFCRFATEIDTTLFFSPDFVHEVQGTFMGFASLLFPRKFCLYIYGADICGLPRNDL